MQAISDATGLQPGEHNEKYDLDWGGCFGWCSNSPNVAIDGSKFIIEADSKNIMERIEKEDWVEMAGNVIDVNNTSQAERQSGKKIRRIVIDRSVCIGAQSCVVVAPGVFQMDDQNLAYLADPNSETDDAVILAAQTCPVLAILLYDAKGKKIFPED